MYAWIVSGTPAEPAVEWVSPAMRRDAGKRLPWSLLHPDDLIKAVDDWRGHLAPARPYRAQYRYVLNRVTVLRDVHVAPLSLSRWLGVATVSCALDLDRLRSADAALDIALQGVTELIDEVERALVYNDILPSVAVGVCRAAVCSVTRSIVSAQVDVRRSMSTHAHMPAGKEVQALLEARDRAFQAARRSPQSSGSTLRLVTPPDDDEQKPSA